MKLVDAFEDLNIKTQTLKDENNNLKVNIKILEEQKSSIEEELENTK
jgi:hypothetical protein